MRAAVVENGERSEDFEVTNGTKQGCMLAPLLFIIFFSMMLRVALGKTQCGIPVQFRLDGDLFNLRRLQALTKVSSVTIRDLTFADDCALVAHNLQDIQHLFDRFAVTAKRFGLTVSLKKTEVLYQSFPPSRAASTTITSGDTTLKCVNSFCYLGSLVSNIVSMDDEIASRIAKAGSAFSKLKRRLWRERGIDLRTKIGVYRAVVLNTLMFSSETWTLHKRHVRLLDQFHLRCLRSIAGIRWQDRIFSA